MDQDAPCVGLGLRNIVFDVDPAIPRKRAHLPLPNFGPCILWPNGWMDEDAALYGSRPRLRPHCTRRGPSSRKKGTAAPPLFSAHVYCGHVRPSQLLLSSCILAKCLLAGWGTSSPRTRDGRPRAGYMRDAGFHTSVAVAAQQPGSKSCRLYCMRRAPGARQGTRSGLWRSCSSTLRRSGNA